MLPLFLFFITFTSIVLGWCYAISLIIIKIFPLFSRFSTFWMIGSMIGVTLFILGMMLANITQGKIVNLIYTIGSIWVGGLTLAGGLALIALLISSLTGISYDHIGYTVGFIILSFAINLYGLSSSFIPRIQEYSVHIAKSHTWHGKKIVMIADTHYGNIYTSEDARKLVEKINTLNAEVVIIPGDFFDGPRIDYKGITKEFENITAPHGVIFANGNHEEYRNTEEMLEAFETSHIRVLNNKKIVLDGMTFAGVTYHTTESSTGLSMMLDSLDLSPSEPTILLKHKPTHISSLTQYPIDLVVSGHTHRGQMWPFSLIADGVYGKYVYGMNIDGPLTSITTSGVGSWGPPQRIGTRSEIVVITLN